MPNRQAADDFSYVWNYVFGNKASHKDARTLRIEATKKRAEERCVTKQTIHRNLKFALGIDRKKNIDVVDQILETRLRSKSST